MTIKAYAQADKIEILDVDLTRWLTDDTHREVEVIAEAPGTTGSGWPDAERAAEILSAHGWRVAGTWNQVWDESRGTANGTLERDPGHLSATVEQA